MQKNIQPMQTFIGVCRASDDRPVVGRLCFSDQRDETAKEARIPVSTRAQGADTEADHATVAQILLSSEMPSNVDPSCPLLLLPALPQDCDGRIALLDPATGMLFVSPDISVLNRLTHRFAPPASQTVFHSLTTPKGRPLRMGLLPSDTELQVCAEPVEGILSTLPEGEEESLYEFVRDMAEAGVGHSLTVLLEMKGTSDLCRLREQARALFRGAVFGDCALLLRGPLTHDGLTLALDTLHRCFCELEEEGREFNGYIPKGLLLDTPLQLITLSRPERVDFLCVDVNRLVASLCGGASLDDPALVSAVGALLSGILRRDAHLRLSVLLRHDLPPSPLLRCLWEQETTEWIAPARLLLPLREQLHHLSERQKTE